MGKKNGRAGLEAHATEPEILDIHDWLEGLGPDQWALDLGSGAGSFPSTGLACRMVALDEDREAFAGTSRDCLRTVGRSGRIPFRDGSFDLLICHHALEHIEDLDASLNEMARVLKPAGKCYFAFPNGYGLCDGIYRYVFEGGGHVNRFRREEIVGELERRLDVRLVRWQKLYSSFVYLRRLMELLADPPPDLQKRLVRIGRLPRWTIGAAQLMLYVGTRCVDGLFGTWTAVYGWAFYFEPGAAKPATEQAGYINVCPYCGAGQPAATCQRRWGVACRCGVCSRVYPFWKANRNTM
jgi:SAM-dependent methyltransferase